MDLSFFNIDGQKERITALKKQQRRLIYLRFLYVGVLALVASLASWVASDDFSAIGTYLGLAGLAYFVNCLFYVLSYLPIKNNLLVQALLYLQIVFDLTLAGLVTVSQGGLEARTTILFALPIVAAGLLFSVKTVYFASIAASFVFIGSIFFTEGSGFHFSEYLLPLVFYPAFFFVLAQMVIYLITVNNSETREKAYDSFLSLLSHQLLHPASTSRAIIDTIENTDIKDTKQLEKYIKMLKNENQDLLLLLNNLVESSRSQHDAAVNESANLLSELEVIAEALQEKFSDKKKINLEFEKRSKDIAVKCHSQHTLKLALTNILHEALALADPSSNLTVSLQPAGASVVLVASFDTNQKNIGVDNFKKFQINTDAKEVNGLGLSLFVAKKVIESCNGNLHMLKNKKSVKIIAKLERA